MKRTNIVLEDAQYDYLKHWSEEAQKSMSAILRDLIDAEISRGASSGQRDPIHAIVGLGRSKKGRLPGQRHDEILYRKQR